jgi:NAD(P)-dependent dehydrogenase (short-subunit alcohol dehydrogenase family)
MKDKTVVITGVASGLGRATALQLAPEGAFAVIIARSNRIPLLFRGLLINLDCKKNAGGNPPS